MVEKYSQEFREDALKLASEIGVRKTSEKLMFRQKRFTRDRGKNG